MPLKKIADLPSSCLSRDHNPPTMIHLAPGVYEHTCSACGHVTRFTVQGVVSGTGYPPSKVWRGGNGVTPRWDYSETHRYDPSKSATFC